MRTYYNIINDKTTINVETILEIGSRDGHDSKKLMDLFNRNPQDVWVVEPNPTQVIEITNSYPDFNIIPLAIFTEESEHDFYKINNGNLNDIGTSSLINRNDDWYKEKTDIITVKTITGEQLLKTINRDIDVCKVDVEGLTYEVLDSFGEYLHKIKSFHLECEHTEIWVNQKLYNSIHDFLINKGYTLIKFDYVSHHKIQSDSIWVLNQYVKI